MSRRLASKRGTLATNPQEIPRNELFNCGSTRGEKEAGREKIAGTVDPVSTRGKMPTEADPVGKKTVREVDNDEEMVA
jgi:hypothetical protein